MVINFLLPGICIHPIGGVKVVLEYSNKMVEDGHSVNIIYPVKLKIAELQKPSLLMRLTLAKKLFTKSIKNQGTVKSWFKLNAAVKEKLVKSLSEKHIPDADITFASSWQTAEWLNTYSYKKGKKMYLLQHFEDWSGTKQEIDQTWTMPLYKIVISKWLQEYAASLGEKSYIVNNGLDFSAFEIENPIEKRGCFNLIMLHHHFDWKGSADGIAAVKILKQQFPQLSLTLFGVGPAPENLPAWIQYFQKPGNLKKLYNDAAIFISPSWGEGWALPPAEAMQCGCAAVLTDIGGHRDYGIDGKDLLLAPVKDPAGFAKVLSSLLENEDLRIAIAKSGHETIQKFTWDAAYEKMKTHF
jgi:glycosyltransferase involved in cell wall biosynthesis